TMAIFFGRLGLGMARRKMVVPAVIVAVVLAGVGWLAPLPSNFLKWFLLACALVVVISTAVNLRGIGVVARLRPNLTGNSRRVLVIGLMVLALLMPLIPGVERREIDLAILLLTYIMLGWGLNVVVGLAGLLDLGYVAFYAVGAYSFALLAQNFGLSYWICLPLAGILAAFFGILLGFPVLRLRGDYLAIVTLGFGEIIRLVLLNWYDFTGGPNGISGIPRPTFFGIPFVEEPAEGETAFHTLFGIEYSVLHRFIFLYYIVLVLALITAWFTQRLRRLPIGRAWEALREDEVACKALGINPTNTKLTAFAIGAMLGGIAGSFFANKQNFISPESFSFIESAIILAIVVLGGLGSLLGVVFATVLLIGVPEMIRELQEYRMLAFGGAMVLIMVWRPRGLVAHREPTIRLEASAP
ncbi:MAG TPA: high-affinity branched-chain amino acid ABC transporter permease LivM, partial [Roseiflexaceae bacterium]|nr:high-affinity branched-chain amino acid ABC transporter permease LivM [Roseiflexaceae bacterium]